MKNQPTMKFTGLLLLITTTASHCPDSSWSEFGQHCYRLSTFDMPWTSAPLECQLVDEAATMASVHSQVENALLDSLLEGRRAWIGLARDAGGEFVWQDGSPVDYLYWDNGQPGAGNCTVINRNKETGQWGTADCSEVRYALCHVPATTPTTTAPTTTPTPPTCPEGWTEHQGTCYVHYEDIVRGNEIEAECQAKHPSATAVSVQDADVNSLLFSLEGTIATWLGLSRASSSSSWKWSDGSMVNYTNWESGAPSSDVNCVVMHGGTIDPSWINQGCGYSFQYFCQLKL